MANNFAARAGTTTQAVASGLAQSKYVAWGTVEVSANPAPLDKFVMCKLPKGALITGGMLVGDKIDTIGNGSACMTINIGTDKALTTPAGTAVAAASTSNALGASWALSSGTFSVVAGYKLDTGHRLPLGGLLFSDGPLLTTDECNAVITVITSAGLFTTGTLTLMVEYYMSQHV